ncbi:hypothetical protein SAMN04487926_11272 [Paraburkholderia steynii]|uniref:Uncharacterized protein n=1 Tax=Paraburkholderia steynii TaxID=1245441 RepID=A0A7Z7B898_9BURK|nr:hypothetical protein SAMN04487926_11272 [Paraburkholderia steynii]
MYVARFNATSDLRAPIHNAERSTRHEWHPEGGMLNPSTASQL